MSALARTETVWLRWVNVWVTGMRLCAAESAFASARLGTTGTATGNASAATLIEHLLGAPQAAVSTAQEDEQVIEHVCGLFVQALSRLLSRRARRLLGLLHHLDADALRVVEQLDRV